MATLKELVMTKLAGDMDGDAETVRGYMAAAIRETNAKSSRVENTVISEISTLLVKALDDKAPASVVSAYEKQLARLSS